MVRTIQLLGSLAIMDDGQASPLLSNKKGCALLAHLIIQGDTVSREHMTDLLWEPNSTQEGLRNLRVLLTRVRPSLPDVAVTRKAMTFMPLAHEQVDYLTLTAAIEQKETLTLLEHLRLYEGDLLAGFYVEDAPRFQEWLIVERERLRRGVLEAHRWLCQRWADEKAWVQGVETAVHWLQLDNLDGEALRWLMQFRAAAGQTAVALTEYEQFRERIQSELNLDLDPDTQALANRLRHAYNAAADALFAGMDFATEVEWPTRDRLASVGLLPTASLVPFRRNPNFVGREAVLRQLAELLLPWPDSPAASSPPVVILHGLGGLGKTQTAVEFCYRYGRFFPGGVFWISFAEPSQVAVEVAAVGSERGLGLFESKERLRVYEQVGRVQRAWQESIPRLLIFDNCEAEELLAEWLPVTGGCRVLVTSRRGVWSPDLGLTTVPLSLLSPAEGMTFLQTLAPHILAEEAQAIAAEVGHLPLALHLIGGFLQRYQQISPADYLSQLQDENLLQHPSLQGRGIFHSPTGHELNVARTYALSFAQFDERDAMDVMAQKLLATIACLAPGEPVTHDLAQAMVVEAPSDFEAVLLAEDSLKRLVALAFLQPKTENQFVMHRLVRAYTRLILTDEASTVQVVEGTMVRLLTAVWDKEVSMRVLPFALNQLRYVTDRALKRQDLSAASLANYLGRHFVDGREYGQAEIYLARALSIRQTLLGEDIETAVSLTNMGTLLWKWRTDAAAFPYFEEAAQICERLLGLDHPKTARSLNNLAILHSRQGHYQTAQIYFEKTLAIYERTATLDDPMIPQILTSIGVLLRRMGQFAEAQSYYERALHMKEVTLGADHYQTTITLYALAYLLIQMGHYEEAQRHIEQVISTRQKLLGQTEVTIASPYIRLGGLHTIAGRYTEAQASLERGLFILEKQEVETSIDRALALTYLGELNRRKGKFAEAEVLLHQALQIFENRQYKRYTLIEALDQLIDLYLQTGQFEAAKAMLDTALAVCYDMFGEQHPFTAQTRLRLGEWHQLQGDVEEALAVFREVEEVLKTAVAPTHIDFIRLQKHCGS